MKLEFSLQFFESENTEMSNFMKIRPVGSELFHEDRRMNGRTDIYEANSGFSQFCENA